MGRGVEKAEKEEETAMKRDPDEAAAADAKLEDSDGFLHPGEAGAPLDVKDDDEAGEAAVVNAEDIGEPCLHVVAVGRHRHHDSVGVVEGDDVAIEDDEQGAAPSVGQKKGREGGRIESNWEGGFECPNRGFGCCNLGELAKDIDGARGERRLSRGFHRCLLLHLASGDGSQRAGVRRQVSEGSRKTVTVTQPRSQAGSDCDRGIGRLGAVVEAALRRSLGGFER